MPSSQPTDLTWQRSLAAFLPYGDSVSECDVLLDNVLTDKATMDSLRTQGFREITCGQRTATL
jgi:hypothetical protein